MNEHGFTTLTDAEEKELYRLQRFYWQEALRCEEAKAYLAGCVMLGTALETLLILMVNCYSDKAARTGKVPMKKGNPKPLLDWKYIELLRVVKAANWLPSKLDVDNDDWNSRRALVGDYAEVVRLVRNLLHPAPYVEEHTAAGSPRNIWSGNLKSCSYVETGWRSTTIKPCSNT
jgi:hypothetical protein